MAATDAVLKNSFSYEGQLKPRNIRLLKLLPAGSRSDDIHCTIDQACLDDDKVQYEALSYTWGDGTQRSDLYCNGKHLSVTSNLGQALRYLRSREKTRTLWIDAICINQADNEEKSHQIALMRDVYTKAHRVIAWIGEENPADAAAMEIGDPNPLPENSPIGERVIKLSGLQAKLKSSLISARTLIQRPWFGRAWIIQEAALAKRLQIQCGEKILDWESLYSNLRLMSQTADANGTPLTFGNISYRRLEFIETTRNNVKLAGSGSNEGVNLSDPKLPWKDFHSAVNNGRLYGASNPRDHIYALLGLVDENAAKSLLVDYSQPHTAIYRTFVRHIVQQTRDLTVLGQIDSSTTPDLASWVPDYARASMVEPLCSDDRPFYAASGDSEARLMGSNDPFALELSGIFIDEVEEIAPGPSTDKEKVFTRSERMVQKQVGKVHPTEILPKLAVKAAGHYFPKAKEILDEIHKNTQDDPGSGSSSNKEFAELPESDGLNRFYKRAFDLFAPPSNSDDNKEKTDEARFKQWTSLLTSFMKDTRRIRQDYIFGPMHPTADVYMKPALEEQWQRLAQKCHPYPTAEDIEDVYWRTLIGNRRCDFTGKVDKPPAFWKDAYRIWQEQLWEKEGMVPRFLNGRGLNLKDGLSSWGGMRPVKGKESKQPTQPISDDLRKYAEDLLAKQKEVGLDDQLQSSSMRQIMSLAISFSIEGNDVIDKEDPNRTLSKEIAALHQSNSKALSSKTTMRVENSRRVNVTPSTKPQDFSPISQEKIKQIHYWVSSYPDISSDEKVRLHETLFADPAFERIVHRDMAPPVVRAKVDQAFKYDFLHIARNRNFCTTKKGYMGWCPNETKKGDRVCLLFGGQAPLVVRRVDKEKWRLLGEAYVHGLMDGEGLGMEGVKMETVRLV